MDCSQPLDLFGAHPLNHRIEILPRLSRAVVHNGVVYLAGLLADNPDGSVEDQTQNILTKMEGGMDFETAVKEAQANKFAEADHSADTDGFDSRSKLSIVASLLFNTNGFS